MQSEHCLIKPQPEAQSQSQSELALAATTASALLPTSNRPFAALSKHFPDGVAWGCCRMDRDCASGGVGSSVDIHVGWARYDAVYVLANRRRWSLPDLPSFAES